MLLALLEVADDELVNEVIVASLQPLIRRCTSSDSPTALGPSVPIYAGAWRPRQPSNTPPTDGLPEKA